MKIYFKENVWKVGFQIMLILGLLGMYFDAALVFVTSQTILFRLALAILWVCSGQIVKSKGFEKGNLVDITYLYTETNKNVWFT